MGQDIQNKSQDKWVKISRTRVRTNGSRYPGRVRKSERVRTKESRHLGNIESERVRTKNKTH